MKYKNYLYFYLLYYFLILDGNLYTYEYIYSTLKNQNPMFCRCALDIASFNPPSFR